MLRKMYLIPAYRLQGSPLMQRNREEQFKKREWVKKRKHDPYAEAVKIRKHHPMRTGLRCVKRWTREILEICNFFKPSDAYRASYQSLPSSKAYAIKCMPRDIDGRNVGVSYHIPTTNSYDGY